MGIALHRMMSLPDFPSELLIYGCGNMGGAMLRGWLAAGVAADRFVIVDPVANNLPIGVAAHRSATELDRKFGAIILGIKPQMLTSLAPEIAGLLVPDAWVISILAGSDTATLSGHFPNANIVRLMPNLAAAIGKSPLGLFSKTMDGNGKEQLEKMLAPLGTAIWLDEESQMDAVTALAGSGPAFVYRFIDALTEGGEAAGLSKAVAARLALAMTEGAASLASMSEESPARLAARVTSPGGTTAAGLAVLDADHRLQKLVTATLRAARDRGIELAKGE
jgi:pyrroline-5-carboxylate reductase